MEALNQRIGLAVVWVCGTGVVFSVGCVTYRGRESAIWNGCGGRLPVAVDLWDGRFFVLFGVRAFAALEAWGVIVLMVRWGVTNARWAWDLFWHGICGAGSAWDRRI